MKKFAVLSLFCCLIAYVGVGQRDLQNKGNEQQDGDYRVVDSLNELAFKTKRFDLSQSFSMLETAAELAKKIDYPRGLATNLLYEAGIYQQNGFDKKALSSYYESLSISKSLNDTFNIARANQQISNALQASGESKKAEIVLLEAMENYRRLGELDEVVNSKNSLGIIRLSENDYNNASKLFSEALSESRNLRYQYGEKKSLYNLGLLNLRQKNFPAAKSYFSGSLLINNQMSDHYGLALDYNKLGFIAIQQSEFKQAIALSDTAYEHAKVINASALILEAIDNMVLAYKQVNDYKEVVKWQDIQIATQKEVAQTEKAYAINVFEVLGKQQDRRHANERLSEKSTFNTSIMIIFLVALVILSLLAYMWFKNYKRAESYSLELADKNLQIEKNSLSLDLLNKAISRQNLRLEESNLMKDKLLSIISHDLRHPLVNTKGILELVNLNLVNPEETKQLLGQLESQYVRSLTLLDNLLFWIRGQMKGEVIDRVAINLRQLMEDLIEDHKIPLQNKRIITQNDVESTLSVFGDKEMLKIIFRNLLSNAIKFTPQEGEIRIYSTKEPSPTIHIKDSGVGMNAETLSKVNAKQYFTTRGTGNEAGSGFGLMLCRDLIEKHNGTLNIRSEPGRGSTFSVQLPTGSPGK